MRIKWSTPFNEGLDRPCRADAANAAVVKVGSKAEFVEMPLQHRSSVRAASSRDINPDDSYRWLFERRLGGNLASVEALNRARHEGGKLVDNTRAQTLQ